MAHMVILTQRTADEVLDNAFAWLCKPRPIRYAVSPFRRPTSFHKRGLEEERVTENG